MPEEPMVMVLMDNDQGVIAFARSLLQAYGIKYYPRNLYIQHFWGLGMIGWNTAIPPVQILVSRTDEEAARDLLSEIEIAPRDGSSSITFLRIFALCLLFSILLGVINSIGHVLNGTTPFSR